jgi:photosystem II stability/assembly factor-like uncharacterized protein
MAEVTTYLSPNGQQYTRDAGPATRIMIATLHGVATLARDAPGAPWRLAGRSLADRHVGQLVFEPRSGKLFAGCHADGGVWVSDDGAGADWRPLTRGLDRPHCYAMAARDNGGKVTVFLGTSPAGLYRSDDLGESWTELANIHDVPDRDKWTFPPPPHIPHVKQIAFHPAEPDTLFVLVEQGAFLKSTDDGATWTDLAGYSDPGDEAYRDLHRLLIVPNDPDTFFLATGIGLYRSDDAGKTYEHLTVRGVDRMGYPDFLFLDPDDDGTIYMGGSHLNPSDWYKTGAAKSCVMRSADRGRTWLELDNGMPDPMVGAFEAMTQHVWDGGMMLLAGTATGEIYATEDRGASWQRISDEVAPVSKDDHHLPFMSEAERKEAMAHRGL